MRIPRLLPGALLAIALAAGGVGVWPPGGEQPAFAQPTTQPSHATKAEATYFLIPVKGVIGKDFTAERLKRYFERADRLKPTVIVLEIDTPGGAVSEAEAIVDLLIRHKHPRVVALVHKALSAGAAITLTCRDIYATETATIGAATSFAVDQGGRPMQLPADVAEKFQSAWRAVCRKAAEHGGHNSLLAEAMADSDFTLTMRTVDGRVVLERNGTGKVVKARGRILTLTAREAISCGLAKSIVANRPGLGKALGMNEWQAVGFTGPRPFYHLFMEKAETLRLPDESLTGAQRAFAEDEWASWYRKEASRFMGSKVEWNLTLRWLRMPASAGEMAGLRGRYLKAQSRALTSRDRVENAEGWRDMREIEAQLRRGLFIRIGSQPWDEHRVVIVGLVPPNKADKTKLAQIAEGSDILLSGRVASVDMFRPVRTTTGQVEYHFTTKPVTGFVVGIELEDCRVHEASREGGGDALIEESLRELTPSTTRPAVAPAPAPTVKTTTDKAQKMLNLAETYRVGGMMDKAKEILESIIRDFPGTPAAETARKELKTLKTTQ